MKGREGMERNERLMRGRDEWRRGTGETMRAGMKRNEELMTGSEGRGKGTKL